MFVNFKDFGIFKDGNGMKRTDRERCKKLHAVRKGLRKKLLIIIVRENFHPKVPTVWVHACRRKFMYFEWLWVSSRPINYRHKLLSFWLSFVLRQTKPSTVDWSMKSAFPNMCEDTGDKAIHPLFPTISKSRISFGSRIRIGPSCIVLSRYLQLTPREKP